MARSPHQNTKGQVTHDHPTIHDRARERSKIDPKIVEDLSTLAMERCEGVLKDVLQLIDHPSDAMVLCTNVSALTFGMAARFLQIDASSAGVETVPFIEYFDALVLKVRELVIENPPPDRIPKFAAEGNSR